METNSQVSMENNSQVTKQNKPQGPKDMLNKVIYDITNSYQEDVRDLIDTMRYSYSDILDDISWHESFSGNEGCMSPTELRDNWIAILFDNLIHLQNQLNSFKKNKKEDEVLICS